MHAQELDEDGRARWAASSTSPPTDFGRIAAQTAKQVMLQRIREAERELKYEEYAGREGDIVTGIIQQSDSRYTLLDLGRVEALLPQAEQVSFERPEPGARLKAYIVEVRKTAKGPQIVVSRTHPGLILELFKLEVPEIADGIVEIKACAREPGHRTKIAVWSNDGNVDPVGACVGARGGRVRQVVNELRGEKIDIVPFSHDAADFVTKALSPAKVKEVRIHPDTGTAEVIVPDHQLSLAIGKEGQNARLAARLTGWRIDIKSETQIRDEAGRRTGRGRGLGRGRVGGRPGHRLSRCGSPPRAARRCRPSNGPPATPLLRAPPQAAALLRAPSPLLRAASRLLRPPPMPLGRPAMGLLRRRGQRFGRCTGRPVGCRRCCGRRAVTASTPSAQADEPDVNLSGSTSTEDADAGAEDTTESAEAVDGTGEERTAVDANIGEG